MIRYFNLRKQSRHFRVFTGLTVEEFDRLVALIKPSWEAQLLQTIQANRPNRKRKVGGGRKKLLETLEERLLLTIIWSKLYPTYLFLEYFFGIDESTVCRTIHELIQLPILQILLPFPDPRQVPGKKRVRTLEDLKELLPPDFDLDHILGDATEQPIPRPERKLKRNKHHSGKKKRFTIKTQIATTKQGIVVDVSRSVPGRGHDYALFKASWLPQIIPKTSKLYLDSGYQGIKNDFPDLNSVIPKKRLKKHQELTRSEKIHNTKQRKVRVTVENALARLKKYQCLFQVYRHSLRNYNKTFRFVATITNFRTLQRLPPM